MKFFILLATLSLVSTNSFAGFEPITVVRPNTITTNTDVMIGFDPFQNPCLRPLPNFLGQTELLEIDANNNINFYITALGTDPCLNIPLDEPPYEFFNIGTFPEGTYQIQLIWVGTSTPLPVPVGGGSLPIGNIITFSVSAPITIPLLNFYSLIILGAFIMLLTFFNFKKKSKTILTLLVVMLVYSQSMSAKTFHILLSSDATPILQSFQNDSLVENVDYVSAVLNPIVFEPEPLVSNSNSFVNIAMNSDCEEIGYPSVNIQGLTHEVS